LNHLFSKPYLARVFCLSPVITIDAMGTQTEIVRLIRQKKADYVVALKSNHSTLYNQEKDWFETAKTQ